MNKNENEIEPKYGYICPPDCSIIDEEGQCSCGNVNCPMPGIWKEHKRVWGPLLAQLGEPSFFEKYGFFITVISAFILGLII